MCGGRQTATVDALGQTTDYGYDNLGRSTFETAADPDGTGPLPRPVTRFTYDAVGNRTSVIDPLGNTTAYAYDARDRRTTVTDARGFATVTTFDLAGNTTSVTDASGNVTRYAYRSAARGRASSRAALARRQRARRQVRSAGVTPVGTSTAVYDGLGRLTSITQLSGNTA